MSITYSKIFSCLKVGSVSEVEFTLDTTKVHWESLVAAVSHLLTRRNIPCVLWVKYFLTVHGVPSVVDGSCALNVFSSYSQLVL